MNLFNTRPDVLRDSANSAKAEISSENDTRDSNPDFRIRMSARSLPKSRGFIILSVSVISPIF